MFLLSLQSGSNGNCIYVEAGGVRLLFDAGISGRQAESRLAGHGLDIRRVDALIISHDHADHARYAGVYQRKFKLPLYLTPTTLEAAANKYPLGRLEKVCPFQAGGKMQFGKVTLETIPTPHDGADGVAFVVSVNRWRLGLFTDLGHPFNGLQEIISSLDGVVLESNYDNEMLAEGPYPRFLKERIQGPGGHLSNLEAAELLGSAARKRLKWACLAHLSEHNNHPDLAVKTHRQRLPAHFPLFVASRYTSTALTPTF